MARFALLGLLALALAAPAWAAGSNSGLLRQASQAPGPGVLRDTSGNAVGRVEQQGPNSRVIYDANGNREGTMVRSGSAWTVYDKAGNRKGTIDVR